jgi:uncharacterized protein
MIIVDTGFFIALLNRKDSFHQKAVAILKTLDQPLITTTPILTETSHLILSRLGWPNLIRFIDSIDNGFVTLFEIKIEHA